MRLHTNGPAPDWPTPYYRGKAKRGCPTSGMGADILGFGGLLLALYLVTVFLYAVGG